MAPDRAAEFTLVTAAFNALKADPFRFFGSKADLAWQRDYITATKPAPAAGGEKYHFLKREGESKDDARKRYARESQQWKYARDPDFARRRREASNRCNAKKRAAKKAAAASA